MKSREKVLKAKVCIMYNSTYVLHTEYRKPVPRRKVMLLRRWVILSVRIDEIK